MAPGRQPSRPNVHEVLLSVGFPGFWRLGHPLKNSLASHFYSASDCCQIVRAAAKLRSIVSRAVRVKQRSFSVSEQLHGHIISNE